MVDAFAEILDAEIPPATDAEIAAAFAEYHAAEAAEAEAAEDAEVAIEQGLTAEAAIKELENWKPEADGCTERISVEEELECNQRLGDSFKEGANKSTTQKYASSCDKFDVGERCFQLDLT